MSDIPDDLDDDDDDLEYDDFNERFVDFLRHWGMAEYMLDNCIGVIFRLHNGEAIDHPPQTLIKKIGFLKSAVKQIPAVAAVAPLVQVITEGFSSEKDLRNAIVHGIPLKIEDDHTAHFMWARQTKNGPFYDLRIVRPKDWERLDNVATDMWAQLLLLSLCLESGDSMEPLLDEPQEVIREQYVAGLATFPGSKRVRDLLKEVFAGGA